MMLSDCWEQTRKVSDIIVHQEYNDFRRDNDLALLKMEEEFVFTERVKAAVITMNQSTVYGK